MFTILFKLYASAREKVNKNELEYIFYNNITLSESIELLQKDYPMLETKKYRFAINKSYINDYNIILSNNTEISVIPPISGG